MSSESDGAIYGELHSAHEPAPAVEAPRKAAKKSVRFDETPTIVNYEPQVEYTPTPSVRTKEQGSRFRVTLWVLLVRTADLCAPYRHQYAVTYITRDMQLIHTIRFIVLADSIAVINFGLLFVGFYGQDLLRVTALRLVRCLAHKTTKQVTC
jgi:hypothetical protein